MTLVERIQELCQTHGTTLVGLERTLKFGRGTIRKWDKSSPSIDKINNVAEYFDVSVDYLLGKSEYKHYESELIKDDILHLIEITDNKDNGFSKLVRNIIDTSFLTINDLTAQKDVEALKIIHDLYRNIWYVKMLCKNEKLFEILEMPELNENLSSFENLKEKNNLLLDKLYKILSN